MKKTLLTTAIIFLSMQMFAERVDRNTAAKVASTIIKEANFHNIETRGSYDNIYIFSGESSFVIVSADDRVRPVIGYSDDSPFVINSNMTNVGYWLGKVNDEIQYAIDNDIEATDEIRYEWKSLLNGETMKAKNRAVVEALLTTKWSQDSPYNDLCPGGSVTGCGATSMAQVMKYWNWPEIGIGQKTYEEDNYGQITVNFGNTLYDWDNMPDNPTKFSSEEERMAVATLMYHCGVSIEMDYGLEGSGAYPSDIAPALSTYFGYKSSIEDVMFFFMSDEEWADILKNELDASRPIIYNGWDIDGGGHSFVCDGYDEYDNFHFNWGWNGYCDGYYAIGALSPGTGGIGSGSGQYNEDNYITIGIEPDYEIGKAINLITEADGYETEVKLSWTSFYDNATYNIYRTHNNNTSKIASNITGTSYTDTEIEYNKEYCYVVRSVVDNMENDESNEHCITVIPNDCYPPSNIQYKVVENAPNQGMKFEVSITWDPIDIANYYIIYANGNRYAESTEPNCFISTNKETVIDLNIQSICSNGYESSLSETITINVKSIGIEEHENRLEIFPNPVDDRLYIKGEASIEEINIFNITGVKVYNEICEMKDKEFTIDVNRLPEGVYLINMTTAEGNIIRRFVKN